MIYGHIEMLKRQARDSDPVIRLMAKEDLAFMERHGLRRMQAQWDDQARRDREGCGPATPSGEPRARPPYTVRLDFKEVPAIGTVMIEGGQQYILESADRCVRRDGADSWGLSWASRCADCGGDFIATSGLKGGSLNRRCLPHRKPGVPARPTATGRRRQTGRKVRGRPRGGATGVPRAGIVVRRSSSPLAATAHVG
jgi:hypothetical protein